jgi:hypothetical protein
MYENPKDDGSGSVFSVLIAKDNKFVCIVLKNSIDWKKIDMTLIVDEPGGLCVLNAYDDNNGKIYEH